MTHDDLLKQGPERAPETPADGATSGEVGTLLRAARERIGEDLHNIAHILRIRYPYLVAIEENRFTDLPGPAYVTGFLRAYSEYLGLDSTEIVRRYRKAENMEPGGAGLVFPTPVSEAGIPGGALVFVGIVVAVLAYGGWYVSTSENNFLAEYITPLPDRLATLLPDTEKEPEPAPVASTPAPEKAAEPVVEKTPEVTPEAAKPEETPETSVASSAEPATPPAESTPPMAQPQEPVASPTVETATVEMPTAKIKPSLPEAMAPKAVVEAQAPATESSQQTTPSTPTVETTPEPVAEVPAAATSSTPTPSESTVASVVASAPVVEAKPVPVATPVPSRILVRAIADSWIQVRDDVAKKMLLTRLFKTGDSYPVPNRDGLTLLAGNAGALEILVDGTAVPSIGGQGAVRRGVALDVKRLLAGTAVQN